MSVDEKNDVVQDALHALRGLKIVLGPNAWRVVLPVLKSMGGNGDGDMSPDLMRRHLLMLIFLDALPSYGPGIVDKSIRSVHNWMYKDYPEHQKPIKTHEDEIREIAEKARAFIDDLEYLGIDTVVQSAEIKESIERDIAG